MNAFEKFLALLEGTMTEPTAYGWYHLMCIGIVIGLIVLVCFTCRNLSDKKFRIILIVVGSLMILMEILKQLNRSYDSATDTWKYNWFYFPFQFCSVPMYVMFIAGLCKECKFREYLTSFLGTFGLFGGIIVMILPGDVFTECTLLNIHTMVHHGLMVVMGVFVLVSGKVKIEHKSILKALAVFGVIVSIAFVGNIVAKPLQLEGFNLFYIGPYTRCHLVVLCDIWDALGITGTTIAFNNFLFLFIYVAGFTLAAYIMLLIAILIKFIAKKIKEGRQNKSINA